jgi:preprotein translocase subunit Sss1
MARPNPESITTVKITSTRKDLLEKLKTVLTVQFKPCNDSYVMISKDRGIELLFCFLNMDNSSLEKILQEIVPA